MAPGDYSTTAGADLEIGLHRRDAESYAIELRFSQPKSDADTRLTANTPILRIDVAALRERSVNPKDYGQRLTDFLFADPAVKSAFDRACGCAQEQMAPLRLRLFVGADASELHDLRWETLRHPQDGHPLLTGEQVLFSRYLSSYDWRPVRLRGLTGVARPGPDRQSG